MQTNVFDPLRLLCYAYWWENSSSHFNCCFLNCYWLRVSNKKAYNQICGTYLTTWTKQKLKDQNTVGRDQAFNSTPFWQKIMCKIYLSVHTKTIAVKFKPKICWIVLKLILKQSAVASQFKVFLYVSNQGAHTHLLTCYWCLGSFPCFLEFFFELEHETQRLNNYFMITSLKLMLN